MLSRLLKGIQNKEKLIYRFIIVIVTLNVLMAVLIAIFGNWLSVVRIAKITLVRAINMGN